MHSAARRDMAHVDQTERRSIMQATLIDLPNTSTRCLGRKCHCAAGCSLALGHGEGLLLRGPKAEEASHLETCPSRSYGVGEGGVVAQCGRADARVHDRR